MADFFRSNLSCVTAKNRHAPLRQTTIKTKTQTNQILVSKRDKTQRPQIVKFENSAFHMDISDLIQNLALSNMYFCTIYNKQHHTCESNYSNSRIRAKRSGPRPSFARIHR